MQYLQSDLEEDTTHTQCLHAHPCYTLSVGSLVSLEPHPA